MNAKRPMSHAEVVDALGDGDWDQATLYRNLQKLAEVSLARVASQIAGVTRYEVVGDDPSDHRHPHFACRACGVVECLVDTTVSVPADPRWRTALAEAELQLVGECPTCRSKRHRTSKKRRARVAASR